MACHVPKNRKIGPKCFIFLVKTDIGRLFPQTSLLLPRYVLSIYGTNYPCKDSEASLTNINLFA